MCGIAGTAAKVMGIPARAEVIQSMVSTLVHRGPDATGEFLSAGVGLGFRRLRIIDLAGGDQPMFSEDGDVVLVCNGEIFNHAQLRAELRAKGHTFRSRCDVEVLVHLYEEHGMRLLDRVNGQFAFALYDRRRRRLFLARDHLGILPLYYTETPDELVFGSEIKAVLRHPAVTAAVDLTGLDQILTFPGLVSPRTMFAGVRSLENGQYLTLDDRGVRLVRYWDLDYPTIEEERDNRQPDEYYVDTLRELLAASVQDRLRADVPVGLYLSGGLDSSLIAGIASRTRPGIPSFSVTFPGAGMDESRYQRRMAQVAALPQWEVPCPPDVVADQLQRVVRHAECPVKESYNACSLRLAETVRSAGITVVLSGEGADELFGGYVGYRFDRAGGGGTATAGGLDALLESALARRLWGEAGIRYERDYHRWRETKLELYSDDLAAEFPRFDCLSFPIVDHARIAGRSPVHQRSYLDVKLRLVDHLLSDHGDRMALANSVEARYPFLDRNVVDFATRIPADLKVNARGEKDVLKRAARGLVPDEIIDRQKFGFRACASPALLRERPEWVDDMLSFDRIKRQGYFNPHTVEHLKATHLRGDGDLDPHLSDDLLLVVLTFGLLTETFKLPGR